MSYTDQCIYAVWSKGDGIYLYGWRRKVLPETMAHVGDNRSNPDYVDDLCKWPLACIKHDCETQCLSFLLGRVDIPIRNSTNAEE